MDTIITSAQNPSLKYIKKLISSSKARRQEGVAIAEGIHLANSFLHGNGTASIYVVAESALNNSEVAQLDAQLAQSDAQRIIVKDSLFTSISTVHASVGILFTFTPHQLSQPAELITDTLLLENVQDPGNIGTLLRTAAASGITKIYLSNDSASVWSPKALRAGMGAQFCLDIYENADLIKLVVDTNIPVFATSLEGSTSLYQTDLTAPAAWIFGNEGQGVSAELISHATQRILIPQASTTVESLNVAAAVAVCLFEQRRQRLSATQT